MAEKKLIRPGSTKRAVPLRTAPNTTRHRLKPVTKANKTAMQGSPPLKFENRSLHGLAVLIRNGGEAIEQVSTKKIEVSFSTSNVKQIRMRSAAAFSEEAEDIPTENCISFKDLKADVIQYRVIILSGDALQVTSGKHTVILDRHPVFRNNIIDARNKRWRAKIRAEAQAETRNNAKRAAKNSETIMEMFEEFLGYVKKRVRHEEKVVGMLEDILKQEPMTDRQRTLLNRLLLDRGILKQVDWERTVADLVASILDQRTPSAAEQKIIDTLLLDEGLKVQVANKRRPGERNLEINEVGN